MTAAKVDDAVAVAEEPVVIEPFGVRGVDFVDIWHSPESPNEGVMMGGRITYFRSGMLVTTDPEVDFAIERAGKKGAYVRSDPKLTQPFVCELCGSPWYSQSAFTRHTRFAHTGGMTRR